MRSRSVSPASKISLEACYRGQVNLTKGWPADPQRGDTWRVIAPVALALASPAFDWDTFVVKSRYITQLRGRLRLEDEARDICAIYDHYEVTDE